MNVLLIEDDDLKCEIVLGFLKSIPGISDVTRAASYQSAVECLVKSMFDIVVLDMTLPVSDLSQSPVGNEFFTFGGRLVLRECVRRKINAKFLVLTQYSTFVSDEKEIPFEQMKSELLAQFPNLVAGCVRLDRATLAWQSELAELLK